MRKQITHIDPNAGFRRSLVKSVRKQKNEAGQPPACQEKPAQRRSRSNRNQTRLSSLVLSYFLDANRHPLCWKML